jgi:hypothetical protein
MMKFPKKIGKQKTPTTLVSSITQFLDQPATFYPVKNPTSLANPSWTDLAQLPSTTPCFLGARTDLFLLDEVIEAPGGGDQTVGPLLDCLERRALKRGDEPNIV